MDLWRGGEPLLLASTSATRCALLEAAGIPVDTEAPGIDERAMEATLPPEETRPGPLAARLAREKALAVSRRRSGRWVVGADQVLELNGRAIARAGSRRKALATLARLSGRTHALWSAFALARDGAVVAEGREIAALTMRRLDRPALSRYADVAGDALTRSAGGYEVEGVGIHLFEAIHGEHSTILGLPLVPLLAALRALELVGL